MWEPPDDAPHTFASTAPAEGSLIGDSLPPPPTDTGSDDLTEAEDVIVETELDVPDADSDPQPNLGFVSTLPLVAQEIL